MLGMLVVLRSPLALGTLDSLMLFSPLALPRGRGWLPSNSSEPSHLLFPHSIPSWGGWWVTLSPSASPDNSSPLGQCEPNQPCPSLASSVPSIRQQDRAGRSLES